MSATPDPLPESSPMPSLAVPETCLTSPPQAPATRPEVGAAVAAPADTPGGGPSTFDAPAPAGGPTVPGYKILGVLGRGGMGVVYKARDRMLNRLVALKMVLAGGHAAPDDLLRFLREAEAVAALRHPNVVQVHEIGDHDGLPYLTLELVPGGSLAARLSGRPLAAADAARLVEKIARGVQAAHEQGIVHRDLKPGNVLLEEGADVPLGEATPKVTDFGLTRRARAGAGMTQTGAIMGTPDYMAPEQAVGKGKEAEPGADVWALGALLYECLTGRPPFQAATPMHTIVKVVNDEPAPPSRLNARVPADLETVCLKCLQKQPARRYAKAAALADDLGRFLRGEPVRARPVGLAERLAKWARRRPALAAVYALGLLTLLLGAGGGAAAWLWQRAEAAEGRAKESLLGERKAKTELEIAQVQLAEAHRALKRIAYAERISLAQREWDLNHVAEARRLHAECEPEQRGWEWGYFRKLFHPEQAVLRGHTGAVRHVAFSPDGKRLASAGDDRTVRLWDAAGKEVAVLKGHTGSVDHVAFSRDGTRLASAGSDGTVRLWDGDGKEVAVLKGHTAKVIHVCFSPDGTRLASGSGDKTVRLWEGEGKEVAPSRGTRPPSLTWPSVRAASNPPSPGPLLKRRTMDQWGARCGRDAEANEPMKANAPGVSRGRQFLPRLSGMCR